MSRPGVIARVLLGLVTLYRKGISPLLGPHCRFAPTCSAYAAQALVVHGAGRGSWLAVRRIGRCHPFHPGGHDPVPPGRAIPSSPPAASSATMEVEPRPVRPRTAPLTRSARPLRTAPPGPRS